MPRNAVRAVINRCRSFGWMKRSARVLSAGLSTSISPLEGNLAQASEIDHTSTVSGERCWRMLMGRLSIPVDQVPDVLRVGEAREKTIIATPPMTMAPPTRTSTEGCSPRKPILVMIVKTGVSNSTGITCVIGCFDRTRYQIP